MILESPISDVKGVGDELAKKFKSLGLATVGELIEYYPRRYEDYSTVTPIAKLRPGPVTIEGVIKQAKGRYVRPGMHVTEAVVSDESGSVRLVWFNQPYREASLKRETKYFISGEFELRYQRLQIINPSVELASDFPLNTARILPVYRLTKGLTSKQIRKVIGEIMPLIKNLPESLPGWIITDQHLMPRAEAVAEMHFPSSTDKLAEARRRLGFEEVFELSLASLLNKQENGHEHSLKIAFNEELAKNFVKSLPFKLTDSQRKVVWQIYQDLEKLRPMNRLVEGDVGAGKTVVATMAALMAIRQNYQVAFMAPTELLARQHADTVFNLLKPLGLDGQVGLLVGSMSTAQKAAARQKLRDTQIKLIIGTHALIQEKVDMSHLGLVVIDEQHRFGVEQRKALMAKAGHMPHVLSLTATPIPRSLALTLYGELDISILSEKPSGRKPIITKIATPAARPDIYEHIRRSLNDGEQMFVVCPLIVESSQTDAFSAEAVFKQFSDHDFKDFRIGLLHGRQKPNEKTATMEKFINHDLDILVSTTVIEVGVDVPGANIIMIESADRFGLAQIHQLRGRVGRSGRQGYCYLMLNDNRPPSKRLQALESTNDGFKLAELDLQIRGPGAIYGQAQHGVLDLRVARLSDSRLIAAARQTAQNFIDKSEDIRHYKDLAAKVSSLRSVTNLN